LIGFFLAMFDDTIGVDDVSNISVTKIGSRDLQDGFLTMGFQDFPQQTNPRFP
jgi:hypothetical protein